METSNTKRYDLEERTLKFALDVALFCKKLPKTMTNAEYVKQLIRSSSSVGANYIEANESLSKKDFLMRAKISRKETKESAFWLQLIKETNSETYKAEATTLYNEAIELKKILSAIIEKSS
ncbi:MAG: four helix bundle protein [Ignavibacteria bacterium]|nr:four helix bundle protein [Ignavibacteria bacterium]